MCVYEFTRWKIELIFSIVAMVKVSSMLVTFDDSRYADGKYQVSRSDVIGENVEDVSKLLLSGLQLERLQIQNISADYYTSSVKKNWLERVYQIWSRTRVEKNLWIGFSSIECFIRLAGSIDRKIVVVKEELQMYSLEGLQDTQKKLML